MKVFILAGGFGTRLRSVVPNLPKPLAHINNRPFLEYLLDAWIEKGADAFYLLVHHQAELIQKHFENGYKGIPVHLIYEEKPLQTGGSILNALNQIEDQDQEVIVLNGDTFLEIDFEELNAFHQKQGSKFTIAIRSVEQNDRYSGTVLDENQKISNFAKREINSPCKLINAGLYYLKPYMMNKLNYKVGDVFSIEDEFFPKLIQSEAIYGYQIKGKFIDIGIPQDYQKAQTFFSYADQNH